MWEIRVLMDSDIQRINLWEFLEQALQLDTESNKWEYMQKSKNSWIVIHLIDPEKYRKIVNYTYEHRNYISEIRIKKVRLA